MSKAILITSMIFTFIACKKKIIMDFDTTLKPPIAEKTPYQLKKHGDNGI